jgi:hypothetical protein
MALTTPELIASLQNEVRILLHLASKIDRSQLDYRPTPKQRSTIELLRYLSIMGPGLVNAIKTGAFDGEAWGKAVAAAAEKDLDAILADIGKQSDLYAKELPGIDFATEMDLFGRKFSLGYHMVNLVLSGHAAYRTQLFLYLKACGADELSTYNLWGGMDAPPAQA